MDLGDLGFLFKPMIEREKKAVTRWVAKGYVSERSRAGMTALLREISRSGEGQSLVEYVLIVALVSVVLIAGLNALGASIVNIPIATIVAAL